VIWSQPPETRLVIWRNFRKTLDSLDVIASAASVAAWWQNIPQAPGLSTPWATDSWPDPWNLFSDGPMDHTLTSVAMAYTLWMVCNEKERIELAVINDPGKRKILLVTLIDKRWLINYNSGEVTDTSQFSEDIEILSTYAYSTFKSRIKA
jgi:hypothetical protein